MGIDEQHDRDETKAAASPGASRVLRPMRFGGERRQVLAFEPRAGADRDEIVSAAEDASARAEEAGAVLAYGFVPARDAESVFDALGWESLGPAPLLVRPLRLSSAAEAFKLPAAARSVFSALPLVAPFGRTRRPGFREIAVKEPRITRLWDRFSIDVGVAFERTASTFEKRVFEGIEGSGERVFIFEDGDRYAIRAMCVFVVKDDERGRHGYVVELLHDRSVTGLRAASHLLGLALREMLDAGADAALAWSLPSSGSYPIYARHAFFSPPEAFRSEDLRLGVRAFDPELDALVTQRDRWYLSYLDRTRT
jgi:hypothetical protein